MTTAELTYHEARTRAICRELTANPNAIVIGPSLSLPFNQDDRLLERFPSQVLIPPYSELATAAAGVGAAIGGLRPLVALSTASFMYYAWPAIVNEAPLVRYLSGGAASAPVAFHVHSGSRRGGGPQHEHTPQSMLQGIPGLRVVAPGMPADIDAALHLALTGPDPIVIIDHVLLADVRGTVPDTPVEFGPSLARSGSDALLVASSAMTQRALAAARALERDGLSVSVLNLPMVAPPPVAEVMSAARDYRVVAFVEESRAAGSPGAFLMASLLARRRGSMSTALICTSDAPAPFAPELLDEVVPTEARIAAEARRLIERRP